jgi:DNA repair exonuclease SbcCD ATPase subunit
MKIIRLVVENIKKITAVEITPKGNLVRITGKNGQGKTSVLDSIFWGLAGTEGIQTQPIRKGQEKANIKVELGGKEVELVVERKFTPKGSTLEIRSPEGLRYPSPQKFLDDLYAARSFDPLGFMRDPAKKQFETLRKLVGIDLSDIEKKREIEYYNRTQVGRDLKTAEGAAAAISVPEGLPDAAPDTAAITERLVGVDTHNAAIRRKEGTVSMSRLTWEDAKRREEAAIAEIEAARERAKKAQAHRVAAELAMEEAEKFFAAAGALQDAGAIRAELNAANAIAKGIELRARKAAATLKVSELTAARDTHTKAIEALDASKEKMVAEAKMPIEGLAFADEQVTYKGLPLDQASDAEQLMVATAIAAALNPKLRVIRIRDASLLDEDAMKRLETFADENNLQIWTEEVNGSGTVGIVMEDGHVKAQEAQEGLDV